MTSAMKDTRDSLWEKFIADVGFGVLKYGGNAIFDEYF